MKKSPPKLKLRDALRVKSAEFWLQLGQPAQALLELQHLPTEAQHDPWAVRVLQCAFRAGR